MITCLAEPAGSTAAWPVTGVPTPPSPPCLPATINPACHTLHPLPAAALLPKLSFLTVVAVRDLAITYSLEVEGGAVVTRLVGDEQVRQAAGFVRLDTPRDAPWWGAQCGVQLTFFIRLLSIVLVSCQSVEWLPF